MAHWLFAALSRPASGQRPTSRDSGAGKLTSEVNEMADDSGEPVREAIEAVAGADVMVKGNGCGGRGSIFVI